MRVLTASRATQGARDNDFAWTVDGELVWPMFICDTDRDAAGKVDPDGGCGCGRSFTGLSSQRATTTAEVTELPLSRADVRIALVGFLEAAGYGALAGADHAHEVDGEVDFLLTAAADWPPGTVLERRGDDLVPR